MTIEELNSLVEKRKETNAPYVVVNITNHNPSCWGKDEHKDRTRAVTDVLENGDIFSGNKIIYFGDYEMPK